MKKLMTVLTLTLMMFVGVGMQSCKNDNPADKFAELLNDGAQKISEANSIQEVQMLQQNLMDKETVEFLHNSNDYELTDADKENIKKALNNFFSTCVDKELEFIQADDMGLTPDQIQDYTKQLESQFDVLVDNAKTLGDLGASFL